MMTVFGSPTLSTIDLMTLKTIIAPIPLALSNKPKYRTKEIQHYHLTIW